MGDTKTVTHVGALLVDETEVDCTASVVYVLEVLAGQYLDRLIAVNKFYVSQAPGMETIDVSSCSSQTASSRTASE